MGPGLSDDSTNSPNVRISDFLCESFYQHSSDSDTARLEYGFTSPSRIDHLVKLFKANIGRSLVPSLDKPSVTGTVLRYIRLKWII